MHAIRLAAVLAVAASLSFPAAAADKIVIGYLNSFTGPLASLVEEQTRGLDLAMEHLGGKMGGLPVELIKVDDKSSPDVAVTEASRLVDRNKVQFVTGILLSNVFNAIGGPLNDAGVFVISGNAGTSTFSGKGCLPNVFAAAFHNDSLNEAAGEYMNKKGVKNTVTVGLNYQAGKDQIGGATRVFKGQLVGQLWPELTAIDFSSEIAQLRSLKPESVYLFMPGTPGITFQRQFIQAGLDRSIKLYGGSFHADELTFAALGDFAARADLSLVTYGWGYDMGEPGSNYAWNNAQNKKMIEGYIAKYKRRPTFFIAHQYDAMMLIDSAVRAVKGNVENKDAVRAALRKADFPSVKGKFKFNNNQYPIQDHYVVKVVKDDKGVPMHKVVELADRDHADQYAKECPMKW